MSNILVGEVWICSGQSNMQVGHAGIPEIKALLSSAKTYGMAHQASNFPLW
ncbi:MAG: hypothetical protein QNL33_03245 [Akkermansiaceae bacterium]